jgi:hypothetical protein
MRARPVGRAGESDVLVVTRGLNHGIALLAPPLN